VGANAPIEKMNFSYNQQFFYYICTSIRPKQYTLHHLAPPLFHSSFTTAQPTWLVVSYSDRLGKLILSSNKGDLARM
jgi:hypothetical protein